ncbi:MAG TPA: hypothetical protein VH436_10700 [Vicinamibacterales bacterium]|jgi:hypothetical protein
MLKRVVLAALVASLVAPLAAQAPAGWKMRLDRSKSAQDPDDKSGVTFMAMGKAFHVAGGPAGVYWNPANTASGNYTLKGTFTLLKPSSHTNYYGLVFGGKGLEGADEQYTYFTVAQNGTFLIKQRKGEATSDIKGYTPSDVVKKPDASGKSVNALEVRVAGDTVSYVVNGTVVHTTPKSALMATDGTVGFRVNHVTEVQVDGFEVQKS